MKYLVLFTFMIPMLGLTQTWVNRTYSNLYDVQARSMVEMGNGNFLVTGTQAFSNGFLSVHDGTGACTATYFLSQSALSSYSDFNQIVKMNDTMAIIGGKISLAGGPGEVWKGITVAVNQHGSVIWMLTHEVSSLTDAVVRDIEPYSDSTVLVLSAGIGTPQNTLSLVTIDGSVLWTKNYDVNETGFQLNDLCLADSNIYMCGTLNQAGNYAGVLLTLENSGNIIDGSKYNFNTQPDFVQLIQQGMNLVVANCGASSSQSLLKMDFAGNVSDHKSITSMIAMPQEQALKPLSKIDSSHFWFYNGGDFGSLGYQMDAVSMLPYQVIQHVGNLQTILQQDTSMRILSSGPIYGIKSQEIMQKHYALTSADSLECLFSFCTYPSNEPPMNQLVPVKINFTPFLSQGNTPNPLNYPFLANEAWSNEPFCVEMLGGIEESAVVFGPNPCDEVLKVEVHSPLEYSLFNLSGEIVLSGQTNAMGYIDTHVLPNGLYLLILGDRTYRIQVMHRV
jgi:hypothetical protein